MLQGKIDMGRR